MIKLWFRKNIYNADANICSLLSLSNFVLCIYKNRQVLYISIQGMIGILKVFFKTGIQWHQG